MTPRIWLSAGEPSGDRHAAALVPALRAAFPGATLHGMGGARMAAAGVSLQEPAGHLGVMGLAEIVRHVPAHVALYRRLVRRFREGDVDLVVLLDYPGLHLRVARAAREAGIPVLYYIAPQLWAWGAWRTRVLRRAVNRLAVILPFEEDWFRARDVPAHFVGHPLLDTARPGRDAARARLGLPADVPVLAVFPGSRAQEVARHDALFRSAAAAVRRAVPDTRVLTGAEAGVDAATLLAAADAALCKSGTITLEAALADTPMVIAYRHHPLTHAVARRLVRVRRIGLVNLIAGDAVAPELVQDAATAPALADALIPLLDPDTEAARRQRHGLALVRRCLGRGGAATRVADLARELVA